MDAFRLRPLALGLTTLLLALFCCQSASARFWTDRRGNMLNAVFIRFEGRKAVMQGEGLPQPFALDDFSVRDRRILRQELEDLKVRDWTDIRGRQIKGSYVDTVETKVVVLVDGQEKKVPVEKLSEADRNFVIERLTLREKTEQLTAVAALSAKVSEKLAAEKAAAIAKASAKANAAAVFGPQAEQPNGLRPTLDPSSLAAKTVHGRGDDNSKGSDSKDGPDKSGASAKPKRKSVSKEERSWTDMDGKRAKGKFVRINGDELVLLIGGKPKKVPYSGLSLEDQNYLKDQLTAAGQADLIPIDRPPPQQLAASVPAAAPAMPSVPSFVPPLMNFGNNTTLMPRTEIPRHTFSRPELTFIPPQAPQLRPMVPRHEFVTEPPRAQYTQLPAPQPIPTPQLVQQGWTCESCRGYLPPSFKAGNSCPSCGVTIDWLEGQGPRPSGFKVRHYWIPTGLIGKLLLGIVTALGGGYAAMRKFFTGPEEE